MIRGNWGGGELGRRLSRGGFHREEACPHAQEQGSGHGGHSAAMCWTREVGPGGGWGTVELGLGFSWVRGGRMLMSVLSKRDPFVWLDPSGCYVRWPGLNWGDVRCQTAPPTPCCRLPESCTFLYCEGIMIYSLMGWNGWRYYKLLKFFWGEEPHKITILMDQLKQQV